MSEESEQDWLIHNDSNENADSLAAMMSRGESVNFGSPPRVSPSPGEALWEEGNKADSLPMDLHRVPEVPAGFFRRFRKSDDESICETTLQIQSPDSRNALPKPELVVLSKEKHCPILYPSGYPSPIPSNYIDEEMSEQTDQDWLIMMSPNPHLTAAMPYSPQPEDAESQTSITYKERSILSSGDSLWLEEEAQKNKLKEMEGFSPTVRIHSKQPLLK